MERTDADEPTVRRATLPVIEDADRKEAGASAAPVNEATAFAPLARTRREAAGTKAWVTVRNINAADAMDDTVALNSRFVDFGAQDYTLMIWISTTDISGPIFSKARSGE